MIDKYVYTHLEPNGQNEADTRLLRTHQREPAKHVLDNHPGLGQTCVPLFNGRVPSKMDDDGAFAAALKHSDPVNKSALIISVQTRFGLCGRCVFDWLYSSQ
jgi:hypothetical protein